MSNAQILTIPRQARLFGAVLLALLLSACSTVQSTDPMARHAYLDCMAEAWTIDQQAQTLNGEPKYLVSARLFEDCATRVVSDSTTFADKERMLPMAMASLNYARGGDIAKSGDVLATFESSFPGKDLYLTEGSSFVDTMRVVTNVDQAAASQLRLMNINSTLRNEILRLHAAQQGVFQ